MAAGRADTGRFEVRHGDDAHAAFDGLFLYLMTNPAKAEDRLFLLLANSFIILAFVAGHFLIPQALEDDQIALMSFSGSDNLRAVVPNPVADHPAAMACQVSEIVVALGCIRRGAVFRAVHGHFGCPIADSLMLTADVFLADTACIIDFV